MIKQMLTAATLIFTSTMGSAAPAAAPTAVLDNGALMGFNGIDVDGVLYDVVFMDGKYGVLGDDFSGFDNFADATKASQALASTFSAIPEYKHNPGIINGCSTAGGNVTCWIETAYTWVAEFVADPFFDPNDISYNQVLTADMAPLLIFIGF